MANMTRPADNGSNQTLRSLPSIDQLLRTETGARLAEYLGHAELARRAREITEEMRLALLARDQNGSEISAAALLAEAEKQLEESWKLEENSRLRRVINATGVVLHTNLGRAPLSEAARKAVADAAGYCTLEFDAVTGERGKRGGNAEALLAELTGAGAALVVNNGAAAALLVLTALADGGEVVVSRGELVEIGGDFRVPDVLARSGATLCEVGTTNRTRLSDFEKAITERTRVLMRVHPSNYKIIGFTEAVKPEELAELAHRNRILFYEDAGSGALTDLSKLGLTDEPVIADSIRCGADLVSFSGDKLLGGPQAGAIVGRAELIARLRRHPLYRALRADKLAYAALAATLDAYRRETALEEIPVLRMLASNVADLQVRVEAFIGRASQNTPLLKFENVAGRSAVGGGSAPAFQPESRLVAVVHAKLTASELAKALRGGQPAIVGRIDEGRFLLDLRTVSPDEEIVVLKALAELPG